MFNPTPAPPSSRRLQVRPRLSTAEQAGYALSGLLIIFWGLRVWTGGLLVPLYEPLSIGLIATGLMLTVASWGSLFSRRTFILITLISASVGFALWTHTLTMTSPGYGTDELAFDQYAAQLLMHGVNPYMRSLAPAYQQFLVPPTYYTYTISGHAVTHLSYPSLSFLLYIPLLALGVHAQAAVYADAFFWVLTAGCLAWALPWPWKWLAVMVLTFTQYDAYILGGITDSLFLPFLILALWRWDRFGRAGEPSFARWIGPLALGTAMAIKQTPWFIAPFLLVGVALEAMHRGHPHWWRVPANYVLLAATAFLGWNVPFIIWSPAAWLHGVLLPLTAQTVPAGQGLVGLWLFNRIGNGNMAALTHAGDFATMGTFALFIVSYPRFKRALVALVPLLFLWPTRSFASYLIDLFPVVLVGALTVSQRDGFNMLESSRLLKASTRRILKRGLFGMMAVCSLGFSGSVALGLLGRQPLDIQVLRVQTSGQFGTITSLHLRLKNRLNRTVTPHFTVMLGGYQSAFWLPASPRTQIRPHATRSYTIYAPNTDSMPSISGGFAVDAFVAHPALFSDTSMYLPPVDQTVILPFAIDHLVPLRTPTRLTVQVRNRLGRPLHQAGITVALGQVIYGERNLVYAESSINGKPEGQTPVTATTNHHGQAIFAVQALQYQPYPIYYQAYITSQGYPHGYSNVVIVRFH